MNFVVTAKAKSKIKDALKEEKRKIAEEGKYIVQRKLENIGAAYNQHNIDVAAHLITNCNSSLDLFYQIAVKNIDLKELKEFQLLGDKLEPPKPVKPVVESKTGFSAFTCATKRCGADHFWRKQRQDRIHIWPIVANQFPAMMYLVL